MATLLNSEGTHGCGKMGGILLESLKGVCNINFQNLLVH